MYVKISAEKVLRVKKFEKNCLKNCCPCEARVGKDSLGDNGNLWKIRFSSV